jgi:hypothetical protein
MRNAIFSQGETAECGPKLRNMGYTLDVLILLHQGKDMIAQENWPIEPIG